MKTILLFAAIVLASCSKSHVEPPAEKKVTLTPAVMKERPNGTDYVWRVAVNLSNPCTANGSATVEWDEYSSSTLIKHRSQVIGIGGANNGSFSILSYGTNSNYTAKNVHISAASISGYTVTY